MRSTLATSLILLACTAAASAEEQVLREVSWTKLQAAGRLSAGEVQTGTSPGVAEQLKIENSEPGPKTIAILQLDRPGVTAAQYALVGRVRYENVATASYLEMWNHFPGGKRFFTRTLADSGPLGSLQGSSEWRPFWLPFKVLREQAGPEKLEVNLVLAGKGTVYLGPLRLVQCTGPMDPPGVAGQWWGERTGGWVGGLGGGLIGILGGLIGTLAGLGKARRLVLGLTAALLALGVVGLAAGLLALSLSQPYAVYYPLLLGGGICSVVIGACLPVARRRYRQIELRKMAAMDIGTAGRPCPDPTP